MNKSRVLNPHGRTRRRPAGDERTLRALLAAHAAGDPGALAVIERLAGEHADSTRKLNGRIADRYARWMTMSGRTPYPADPADVAAFLTRLQGRAYVTIVGYLNEIARAHVLRGMADPTQHEIVARTMETLRRTARGRKAYIRPMPVEDYLAVRACIPRDLRGARDRLVLGLGFEGLLWGVEILNLDVPDVAFVLGGLLVTVRGGEHPRTVAINGRGDDDVVGDAAAWLRLSRIADGPLIRSIDRHGGIAPRTCMNTIRHVVKSRVIAAGLPPERYGLHSLRQGYIASALASGVPDVQVAVKAGIRTVQNLAKYRTGVHAAPTRHSKLVT